MHRRTLLQSALGLGSLTIGGLSAAQAFPSKPVTLVLPFSAGGISDVMARALGQHMAHQLGKSVIVDNKPAAGGQIAASAVLQQAADGHTVYVAGTAMFAINQTLFRKFAYDPVKDFEPVTSLVTSPLVLVVAADSPVRTLSELVALSRSSKQGLTFASQGLGSIGHLLGELFRSKTGGSMSHVAYKGSVPALQDVMTNRVDFMFDPTSSTEALIRGRKLRALAIASARRSPQLPDVPTMAELGVSGVDAGVWFGAAVRSGTPATVVQTLNRALVAALQDPGIQKRFESQGMLAYPQTPEQFKQFIHSEIARWAPLIQSSGAGID
ncbi:MULTISPECIES: tripartite tricarboxylate transporter substrate binding protein [Comamonas]|uniref:Bug family tripartite tricarboxylate transporter substrate binding protein n=1 Tax=Comamonas TaxID=283 RepID=UPI001ED92DE3|nr:MULTISPECIES: tripartite tricarboxylate transporter substrate binding protein [Comamonas]